MIKLHKIAHGRAGDKGNRLNVTLFPYKSEHYRLLCDQVTEDKVLACYAHRGATAVKRYEVPNLCGLNFVIDNVLEGGVNSSLGLDAHGKTNAFLLLGLEIEPPADWPPGD